MNEKRAVYILPKIRYFSEGRRGRVTHALGVIEGLKANGWLVDVLSGPGLEAHCDQFEEKVRPHEIPCPKRVPSLARGIVWRRRLYSQSRQISRTAGFVMIRYAISQPNFAVKVARGARSRDITSILEINSLAYHYIPWVPGMLRRGLLRVESALASQFNVVYVVSTQLKEDLVKGGCSSRIGVIPNAASGGLRPAREGDVSQATAPRIVYCGILQAYYTFGVLVEAFRRIAEEDELVRLAFYGDGPQLARAQRAADGHERVLFHGRYEHAQLPEILDRTQDILVLPYAARERVGSPIKLFEYLSLGVPVVASDVGQVAEVIKDGRTGYLYRGGSVSSLVEVLLHALRHPRERIRVASRGLEWVRDQHTWTARMEVLGKLVEKSESSLGD